MEQVERDFVAWHGTAWLRFDLCILPTGFTLLGTYCR